MGILARHRLSGRQRVRFAAALAVTGLVALAFPGAASAASAQCANPSGTYAGAVPWGQKLIDPPRLWPLTRGDGQLVAVIGTGVDGRNAQFAPGQLLGGTSSDCDGRGTVAAGIVAAQPDPSTTFTGIAPGARILPIAYGGDPGALADAIDTAVQQEAGVVLIAVPAAFDTPALSAAVSRARDRGAVVVSPAAATQQGARTYPTAASGVLAVGSANQTGEPVQTESGDYVGISAPGTDLVSTSAGTGGSIGHRWPVTDPGLAAAYVAGVAALVRAYHPALTGDQVVTRLTLTAHRPATGGHDPRLGWGVIDAYAALASTLPATAPGPGAPPSASVLPAVLPAAAPPRPASDVVAGTIALAGVALAAAAGVTVAAIRRARRRNWRPTRFTS